MSERAIEPIGPLREVRGPSALGGGVRRFFDLLWLMSVTEFKRTYFGTVLGYVWSLMRPLMLFGVLLFVFTQVFKLGSATARLPGAAAARDRPLHLLPGSDHRARSARSSARRAIVRKTQFPRLVIPLATVLTCAFNLFLNLSSSSSSSSPGESTRPGPGCCFPFALAALLVLTCAISMMLSVLYVRFRDVAIIWVVLAQMLFYATPVLYPIECFDNADARTPADDQPAGGDLRSRSASGSSPNRNAPTAAEAAGRRAAPAAGGGDLRRRLRLRRLDLQARGAAHRRGPLDRSTRRADPDRLARLRPRRCQGRAAASRGIRSFVTPSRPGRRGGDRVFAAGEAAQGEAAASAPGATSILVDARARARPRASRRAPAPCSRRRPRPEGAGLGDGRERQGLGEDDVGLAAAGRRRRFQLGRRVGGGAVFVDRAQVAGRRRRRSGSACRRFRG